MRNKVKERDGLEGVGVAGGGAVLGDLPHVERNAEPPHPGSLSEGEGGRRSRAFGRGFEVVRAREMGMCFGVRDALTMARGVERPVEFTVFGQLVHNPAVTLELAERGFELLEEGARTCAREIGTSGVLITAHGVSDAQRQAFAAAGKKVVDTTCPLVRKAHAAAVALGSEGRHVVVVGKAGHVEVMGLTGDLASFDVVADAEAVRAYEAERLGVVAQTTVPDAVFDGVVARVREMNPGVDVKAARTVCQPTRDRQEAVRELLEKVDALVVVGGANSNNSRMLAEAARKRGKGAILVDGAAGLVEEEVWAMLPHGKEWCVVGLTAGTSALDETVEEVEGRLRRMASGVKERRSDE